MRTILVTPRAHLVLKGGAISVEKGTLVIGDQSSISTVFSGNEAEVRAAQSPTCVGGSGDFLWNVTMVYYA